MIRTTRLELSTWNSMIDSLVRSSSQQCRDMLLVESPLELPGLSSCNICCSHGSGASVWASVSFSCMAGLSCSHITLGSKVEIHQKKRERKSLREPHFERSCSICARIFSIGLQMRSSAAVLLSSSLQDSSSSARHATFIGFHANAHSSVARSMMRSSPCWMVGRTRLKASATSKCASMSISR